MKHICFVLTTPLALNTFLLRHLAALAQCYRVSVCVNTALAPISPDLDARVELISLPIQRRIAPWSDLAALVALWRLFRRQRFDLVHSLMPKSGLLAMIAACLAGVPHRLHTFTGQVWATRTGPARRVLQGLDRVLVRCATGVLADSFSQRDFLVAQGVAAASAIRVLGRGSICGVDPRRFRPDPEARASVRRELDLAADGFVFVYLGRLTRDKGVLDLARAFAGLESSVRACLLLVGPDEGGMSAGIEEICGERASRLRIVAGTFEPERYLAAADVLVLPSYREGFGMVVIEAGAVGLPAIASRIYGVTDAVEEGRTGLLFQPGDVPALRAAMQHLLDDAPLREELGARARERALREFSADQLTAAWCGHYEELFAETAV
ncbi:MAG: glycosyltransferase family 4 protein [Betaproteobacteria bacterium]|nr:glycosyltransferase family 4 protein [Betaproteobacteria bacterium]